MICSFCHSSSNHTDSHGNCPRCGAPRYPDRILAQWVNKPEDESYLDTHTCYSDTVENNPFEILAAVRRLGYGSIEERLSRALKSSNKHVRQMAEDIAKNKSRSW